MSVIEVPVTTVPAVTTRDVLHRAADLLGEYQWLQGEWRRDDDAGYPIGYCVAGAIYRSSTDFGNGKSSPHFEAARDALHDNVGRSIVSWNNAPGRTKAEVVACLREAAEAAA